MRFIHIGDVHLGANPDGTGASFMDNKDKEIVRGKEIEETFDKVLSVCNEKEVDLLLIAGDLYHRQPLLKELKELNYKFSKLRHTKVVLIAGNHDYISSRSNYIDFSWCDCVCMLDSKDISSIYMEELNTEIYGFSYHTREIKESMIDGLTPIHRDRINILLAHGGTSKDVPMNYKRISENGFDYVALGHIHIPNIMEGGIAYCGSLEPLDRTEVGPRGYMEGDILEKNKVNIQLQGLSLPWNNYERNVEFIPCSKREYINLAIPVESTVTQGQVKDMIKDRISSLGKRYMVNIYLEGYRDSNTTFSLDDILSIEQVSYVMDSTVPDFDFEEIHRKNADNIIGEYIKAIATTDATDSLKEKALYYGIAAFMNSKV